MSTLRDFSPAINRKILNPVSPKGEFGLTCQEIIAACKQMSEVMNQRPPLAEWAANLKDMREILDKR